MKVGSPWKCLAKVHGGKRGLPVVQVHNVGPEQMPRHAESGHREHRETEMIVGEIALRSAVDSIAIV